MLITGATTTVSEPADEEEALEISLGLHQAVVRASIT